MRLTFSVAYLCFLLLLFALPIRSAFVERDLAHDLGRPISTRFQNFVHRFAAPLASFHVIPGHADIHIGYVVARPMFLTAIVNKLA
jgi:hypothetical protein